VAKKTRTHMVPQGAKSKRAPKFDRDKDDLKPTPSPPKKRTGSALLGGLNKRGKRVSRNQKKKQKTAQPPQPRQGKALFPAETNGSGGISATEEKEKKKRTFKPKKNRKERTKNYARGGLWGGRVVFF